MQQLLLDFHNAVKARAQARKLTFHSNAFSPSINDRLRATNVTNCHCKFQNNKNDVGFVKPFRSSSFFCVCIAVYCTVIDS